MWVGKIGESDSIGAPQDKGFCYYLERFDHLLTIFCTTICCTLGQDLTPRSCSGQQKQIIQEIGNHFTNTYWTCVDKILPNKFLLHIEDMVNGLLSAADIIANALYTWTKGRVAKSLTNIFCMIEATCSKT